MTDMQGSKYARKSKVREPKLFVIATEGEKTEAIYFEALKEKLRNNRMQILILQTKDGKSSPRDVFERLSKIKKNDTIDADYDELWMVCDIDYWQPKMLKEIFRECKKKNINTAFSNPKFELWLLLHFIDVNNYNQHKQMQLMKKNQLELALKKYLVGYDHSRYSTIKLMENVDAAIENARLSDKHPNKDWPENLETKVYRLLLSLNDFNVNYIPNIKI